MERTCPQQSTACDLRDADWKAVRAPMVEQARGSEFLLDHLIGRDEI